MTELLAIGGILFVVYTLTQGQRAKLAMAGSQPNVLLQNTSGRETVVAGEPNSPSPLNMTRQAIAAVPVPAVIAPPVPPFKPSGVYYGNFGPDPGTFVPLQGAPVSIPVISGSTSFTTASDPATSGGIGHDAMMGPVEL